MKAQELKEKGLMETILLNEIETITVAEVNASTELLPHWKCGLGVKGSMRCSTFIAGYKYSNVKGHQRPF